MIMTKSNGISIDGVAGAAIDMISILKKQRQRKLIQS
jgi:hypothetical protein